MKKWYDIAKDSEETQITIYDEIGGMGVSISDFSVEFNDIKDSSNIRLLLNSPGGDVIDGTAIYNVLSTVKDKLTVEVIGLAGSIASIIALAGHETIMDEGSYYMIHNPSMISLGNANDLRKDADLLDKVKNQIISIYQTKTKLDINKLSEMMNAETWMTADEALQYGFIDSINKAKCITNSAFDAFDLSAYKKAPKSLKNKKLENENMTIRDLEKTLRDVGLSNNEAKKIASLYFDEPKPRDEVKEVEDDDLLGSILCAFK
jgi:ATP-dependent Clp protease protease subunit